MFVDTRVQLDLVTDLLLLLFLLFCLLYIFFKDSSHFLKFRQHFNLFENQYFKSELLMNKI